MGSLFMVDKTKEYEMKTEQALYGELDLCEAFLADDRCCLRLEPGELVGGFEFSAVDINTGELLDFTYTKKVRRILCGVPQVSQTDQSGPEWGDLIKPEDETYDLETAAADIILKINQIEVDNNAYHRRLADELRGLKDATGSCSGALASALGTKLDLIHEDLQAIIKIWRNEAD